MNSSFAPFGFKLTARHLGQIISTIWRRLTEPAASLQEPERCRQAQFLASFLLIVLLFATILTPLAAYLKYPSQPFWQETTFQIVVITDIFLIIAYSLSRSRYYRAAAMLAISVMTIAIFAAAIPDRSWTEILIFDYLLIVILISSVFFSIPTTLTLVIGCVIGMLLFPTFVPTAPLNEIVIGPINFVLITSASILIITHYRNLLERDRRAVLAESESENRLLLEQAADGIFIADRKGNYVMVNPKGCEMLGYSLDELLRLNVKDIVPAEDLAERPLQFDELFAGKTAIYERRLRRKDGTLMPAEISARMVEDGRLQAIVRDISERKQAEKVIAKRAVELEAVAKLSTTAATILDVNQLLQTIVDLTKSSFNLYHAHIYLLNEPTVEQGQKQILVLASGAGEVGRRMVAQAWQIPLDQEQSLVARAARTRQGVIVNDVKADANFLPNPLLPDTRSEMAIPMIMGEQLLGVFDVQSDEVNHFTDEDIRIQTILTDQLAIAIKHARLYEQVQHHAAELERRVTERTAQLAAANQELANEVAERKQAEEAIKRLNEDLKRRAIQLEAANRELEAFSYSVSHDLRAPLRAIDGFSQALLEDCAQHLDEAGQDYLRRVRTATQRMGQLIDDMLNLSRITRSELRRQPVNLSAIAAMIAWELRQTQLDRQVEFIIRPGITAEGDPQLLRVALENLLGNAWKFTQKQPEATIEFGLTQHQGQLTYFVRDNGVGFDMNYADKLFGPFQRLHARHEFEGTGIGLATVQRVIQRHGGRVWAEATVGQGATFFFTFF